MDYLVLFLFGVFCDRFIFPMLDGVIMYASNRFTLDSAKIQSLINKISNDDHQESNLIGFQYDVQVDEYDDDEFEEEDKLKQSIGFKK